MKAEPIEVDCLNRTILCSGCGWSGRLGDTIAADVLRCPKCRSDRVDYFVASDPAAVQ